MTLLAAAELAGLAPEAEGEPAHYAERGEVCLWTLLGARLLTGEFDPGCVRSRHQQRGKL